MCCTSESVGTGEAELPDAGVRVAAPAKVNLTLEVGERRSDSYHAIDSVMQTVSLYDYLTIAPRDDGQLSWRQGLVL